MKFLAELIMRAWLVPLILVYTHVVTDQNLPATAFWTLVVMFAIFINGIYDERVLSDRRAQSDLKFYQNERYIFLLFLSLIAKNKPAALREVLSEQTKELISLFDEQQVLLGQQQQKPVVDQEEMPALTTIDNKIIVCKEQLSRLINTAESAGLTLPDGWKYPDLVLK